MILLGDRHSRLISAIIIKAIRIKLDIYEFSGAPYVLSRQNYQALQEIKTLIAELEEADLEAAEMESTDSD